MAVADALLAAGKTQEALEAHQLLVQGERVPFDAVVNYTRLLIQEQTRGQASRDLAAIEQTLERIAAQNPQFRLVPILKAEIRLAGGKPQEALTILHEARAATPDDVEFLAAEVAMLIQIEDWDAAEVALTAAEEQFPASKSVWSLRGRYLIHRYGASASQKLRALALHDKIIRHHEAAELWEEFAHFAYSIQDQPLTQELARLAADRAPHNLSVRLLLLESIYRTRQFSAAQPVLAEIERIDGRGAIWNYSQAVQLALTHQSAPKPDLLRRAQAHLAEAQAARPGWGRSAAFAAQICELQKEEELALEKYRQAISLGVRDPLVIRHMIDLLFAQKRYADVDRLVAQLSDQG
jgi:Flp pilus assembly protein TadD